MKKTRSITTTVNVAPSDEVFVPKLGDVPNETARERKLRQNAEWFRKYYPKIRQRQIRQVIENRRKKRLQKKMQERMQETA